MHVANTPGEFAEAVRDQFITERQEYLSEVEQRIMDETLQQPDCNRDQVAAAMCKMDPNLPKVEVRSKTMNDPPSALFRWSWWHSSPLMGRCEPRKMLEVLVVLPVAQSSWVRRAGLTTHLRKPLDPSRVRGINPSQSCGPRLAYVVNLIR